MSDINFIGLRLTNDNWDQLGSAVKFQLFDWINIIKCTENKLPSLFEKELHCTIIYDKLGIGLGKNMTDYYMRIKYRDLFNQLRNNRVIKLNTVEFNTFNNEDAKVLKIDFTNSEVTSILKQYRDNLVRDLDLKLESDYRPHLTLTYLKPDTPNKVIDEFINNIDLSKYMYYNIDSFIISESESPSISLKI